MNRRSGVLMSRVSAAGLNPGYDSASIEAGVARVIAAQRRNPGYVCRRNAGDKVDAA